MSNYRTRRNQYKQLTVFQYEYSIFKQCWIEYKYLVEHFETYSPLDLISQGKQISHSILISIANQIGITITIGKKVCNHQIYLYFRYTQQGFGNKKVFQYEWQKVNAKEFPSPDRYRVRQDPGIDQLKRSFGLSWEAYSKTYLPYNKHQAPEVAKFLPGPGEYNVLLYQIFIWMYEQQGLLIITALFKILLGIV